MKNRFLVDSCLGWFCFVKGQEIVLKEHAFSEKAQEKEELHHIAYACIEFGTYLRSGTFITTDVRKQQILLFVHGNLVIGLWILTEDALPLHYQAIISIASLWESYLKDPLHKTEPLEFFQNPYFDQLFSSPLNFFLGELFFWGKKIFKGNLFYHQTKNLLFIDRGKRKLSPFDYAINELLHTPEFTHDAVYVKWWYPDSPSIEQIKHFLRYVETFGQMDPDFFPPLYFPSQAIILAQEFPPKTTLRTVKGLNHGILHHEYYVIPSHAPALVKKINIPPPSHHCSVHFYQIRIRIIDNSSPVTNKKEILFEPFTLL